MVTWAQLGSGTAILVGLAMAAFGALMVFAGSMSSAPAAGESTAKSGCVLAVVGIVLALGAIVALVIG